MRNPMKENNRFKLVFAKLRVMLEEGGVAKTDGAEVVIHRVSEVTQEEHWEDDAGS